MGPEINKLIQPIGGKPLLAWSVDAMLEAGVDPVVVVTGYEAESVRAALAPRPCRFIEHAGWAQGLGSSIARGAASIAPGDVDAVILCLGDLPGIQAADVERLLAAEPPELLRDRILVPVWDGQRGHPVVFGSGFLPALSALTGDQGARRILDRNADAVTEIESTNADIREDLDTPGDFDRWRARIEMD
jgi:molybdenum cofactor cytidylyltransferase